MGGPHPPRKHRAELTLAPLGAVLEAGQGSHSNDEPRELVALLASTAAAARPARGPMSMPSTSRRPSLLTPTAMMTVTRQCGRSGAPSRRWLRSTDTASRPRADG